MKRHTGMILFSILALLGAYSATAQETIYVLQELPSEIHAFTFDGSSLTPLDINPDPTSVVLPYQPQSRQMEATDEWFVLGSSVSNSSTNITDPNGISLPPSSTTVNATTLILTSDGKYALPIEVNQFTPALMAVVDIDPASPTFLEELTILDLQPGLQSGTSRGVLSSDGLTLYTSVHPTAGGIDIHAIDLSNPATLSAADILSTTSIAIPASFNVTWDPAVSLMRIFPIGGVDHLFVARGAVLHVIELTTRDTLTLRMTHQSNHPVFGPGRDIRDLAVFDDAGTPRAVAYTDTCDFDHVQFQCLPSGEEELVVLDLSLPLPLEDTSGTRVSNTHRLLSPAGEAGSAPVGDEYVVDHGNSGVVELSADEQTLFLLANNPSSGDQPQGRLRAFDVASVVSGPVDSATPVDDSIYFNLLTVDLLVRDEVLPAAGPPVIADAVLDPSEGGGVTIENDAAHNLDVTGSNLSNVTRVALGTSFINLDGVTPTTADITVPALVPTGRPTLSAINDTSGVGSFDGLVVVPPGDFLPNAVAYVGNDTGTVSVVSASTSGQVVPSFPSIIGLNGLVVSPDGRYLMANGFSSNQIGVHCIVLDDETIAATDPGNPQGYADYQWSGCSDWNDLMYSHRTSGVVGALAAAKPDRSRAYINTIFPTVDIVDMTASPPVAVASIPITDQVTRNLRPRGIAATDSYLYLGNDGYNRNPVNQFGTYVVAVDISDDVIDPTTEIFLIDIPALSAVGAFGRGDGLAVHPDGTRLYYAMGGSPNIWILDIGSDPTNPPAIQGPAVAASMPPGEVFNLLVAPDGEFLYLARRSGDTQVYDLSDKDNPVLLNTIATGPFSNAMGASPNGDFVYVPVLTRSAVVVLDARTGSPTQHQALTVIGADTGSGVVAVTPGVETEAGSNVAVEPIQGAEITFPEVTSPGVTSVTAANSTEIPLSADFEIAGVGVFYDVETTATFETSSGPIVICFDYDDTNLTASQEAQLKLLHEEEINGSECKPPGPVPCWADVTAPGSPDTQLNQICGEVTSFSQFVAAIEKTVRPRIDIKPGDPDNEINLSSNAVVNVGIHGSDTFDVNTIDVSTLTLAGGPIRQKQKGAAATYTDLDGDGYLDLKAQFQVSALQLTQGSTTAEVGGDLSNGQQMLGTDAVSVVQ